MTETYQSGSSQSYHIRPFASGDEAAVLELQNIIFKSRRYNEDWRWKNDLNPYYKNLSVLAFTDDGKRLAGTYSAVGFQLNFGGRPILVGQPTDTMVHPDFRKQGLFLHLYNTYVGHLPKIGVKISFGFPNPQVLGAYMRYSEVGPVCYIQNFARQFGIFYGGRHGSFVKKLIASPLNSIWRFIQWCQLAMICQWLQVLNFRQGISISIEDDLPQDYDEFWKSFAAQTVLSIWKDRTYLNWRYMQHPHWRSKFFCARKNGKLVTFGVLQIRKEMGYISELMILAQTKLSVPRLMVVRMLKKALRYGFEDLRFYGKDNGTFAEVLAPHMRRIPTDDVFLVAGCHDENDVKLVQSVRNHESWCVTSGDLDYTF